MASYCDDGEVTQWLPPNLPASVDTSGERAAYITKASDWVESQLVGVIALGTYGSTTQMFPDKGSSPDTPALIQMITGYYAAGLVGDKLVLLANWDPKQGNYLRKRAAEEVDTILSGRAHVIEDGSVRSRANIATDVENTVPRFTIATRNVDGDVVGDDGTLDGLVAG